MAKTFFITASGTHIGKTFVTAALTWQLRQRGEAVICLKPVASGYDSHDPDSDTAILLNSMAQPSSQPAIDRVSPWRFSAPLSPNMAAAREGRALDVDDVVAHCRQQAAQADYVLVEGVGGVMAPLNDRHTVMAWMQALSWPVILVGGSYLGALSHTLSAVAVLQASRIPLQAVIISESGESSVPLGETVATVRNFIPPRIPLVSLPRNRATHEPWKTAPPLHGVCDHEF